jgi:hypothetical protein
MSLDSIVSVTIDAITRTPTRAGFGTALIAAYHTNFAERVRSYDEPADMLDDGFTVNDPAYKAATALKAQNPSPPSFKVGRRASAFTQGWTLVPTNTDEDFVYQFRIITPDGTSTLITYTNGAAETVATIVTALTALITAITDLTATDNVTDVGVAADNAGELFDLREISGFTVPVLGRGLDVADVTADPGIVADVTAIRTEDDDWYALILDSNSQAEVESIAVTIETLAKIFVPNTMDTDVKDGSGGSVADTLNAASYARTGLLFSGNALLNYAGAAWLGGQLPRDPGSSTWAFKTLATIAADPLTPTEITNLEGLEVNHYQRIAGIDITRQGVMAGGEFIDITRGIDFITARMQERVFGLLASNPKVPFTDAGVDLVRGEMLAVLGLAVGQSILAEDPEPTVTAPLVANVSTADKAIRQLPDMNFDGTLAGAIHRVVIRGTLTV